MQDLPISAATAPIQARQETQSNSSCKEERNDCGMLSGAAVARRTNGITDIDFVL
jgi:hypothetical protein